MAAETPAARLADLARYWRIQTWLDLLWVVRDLRSSLSYYVSDVILGGAAVTAAFLLAERFGQIGEWSRPRMFFMLGFALLARGLIETFFGFNVAQISRRIGRGQLDHLLVQPRPLWAALATEGFAPMSGTGMLLPGVGLVAWALRHGAAATSPIWWLAFLLNLAASIGAYMAITYIVGSLAFWAPRGAEEINSSSTRLLDQLRPFPLDGLPAGAAIGLTTVLPVGLIAWLPSRALVGIDPRPLASLATPAAALALGLLALWLFNRGMQHYGRTGSGRYLSFGHRR